MDVTQFIISLIIDGGKPKSKRVSFKKAQSTLSYVFSKINFEHEKAIFPFLLVHVMNKLLGNEVIYFLFFLLKLEFSLMMLCIIIINIPS